MIGIVIVSHSQKLAEGVVELAKIMAPAAQLEAAGGLDYGGIGTSFTKISQAIDKVYSEDGVAVLMDMGSAVMTTEMVMEDMPDRKIKMFECPLVEGAVVAAVESLACNSLDELAERAAAAAAMKKISNE